MSKIKKLDNVKYEVEFNVRPHSCKDMLDSEGNAMKGLPVKSTFDFTTINPEKVDVPDVIMELTIGKEIISYQEEIRKLVPVKDFKGLETAIKGLNPIHAVGVKAKRVAKEDTKTRIKRLEVETGKKMTESIAFKMVMDELTDEQVKPLMK